MSDQKESTDTGYKDPDSQEIGTFGSYILGGEDQDVRDVGFEGLEIAIEKTENAEVVSNIILTALKTKENLSKGDRYRIPKEKRTSSILRLIDLLEEANEKECFFEAPGVAEECIKQAIVNTEWKEIDSGIFDILETLYGRNDKEASYREGTRGEQFIENILDKGDSVGVFHIIRSLPKKEFFFERPKFVLSFFKQVLEKIDRNKEGFLAGEQTFMEELTRSDLLFANPELASKISNILIENGLITSIEINFRRSENSK